MLDEFPRTLGGARGAFVALTLTLALGACGGSPVTRTEPAAREPARVVGGEVSPPGGREDGVLMLVTELDGEELVCSASLVAKNLALTARHCVSELVRGLFSCSVQGELLSADEGAGILGGHLPAEGLEFYDGKTPRGAPLAHGKQVLSTLSETICVNDLAFVVLDRDLDLPVMPLRLDGRAERDEPVTLVGYGLDDAMSQTGHLDLDTQPRTRKTGLRIADVGPDEVSDVTTAPPRSVVLEGPAGCLGDSGGPLLAAETGAVLGVYSLLAGSSCLSVDARHFFAHVPVFQALREDAFAAAMSEPTPEMDPPPEPAGGEGGTAGHASGAPGGRPGASGGKGGTSTAGGASAGDSSAAGDASSAGDASTAGDASHGGEPNAAGEDGRGGGTGGRAGRGGAPNAGGAGATSARRGSTHGARSGCALATAGAPRDAGVWLTWLAVLGAACVRRRAQCRFSSGSS